MKRTAIPVLNANAFDGLSITDSDLHSKYFGTPRLTSFSMKSKSRSLFYIIPVAFLLFCSTNAATEIQKLGDLNYEFSQSERSYTLRGSFLLMADPSCLLHVFYDIDHLSGIATDADSIVLLRKGDNWYEVALSYRKLLLISSKFIYRRTLNQKEKMVKFEMIESEQPSFFLSKVVSSKGYYEIKTEKEGCKVVYFQEWVIGSKLQDQIFFQNVKKQALRILQGLKDYAGKVCH